MADVDSMDKQKLLNFMDDDEDDETLLDTGEVLSRSQNLNTVPLEGDITVPGAPQELDGEDVNTLDEPVRETVMRDLRAVGSKFIHVLYPKQSKTLLREWDLWGPLILCVFLAMLLQDSTSNTDTSGKTTNREGVQFAEVFVIYWVGAVVITLNSKLLGGSVSFFQSVCVLGYCVLPLIIALIISKIIVHLGSVSTVLFILRCVTTLVAFAWCTFASTAFLGDSQPPRRKALAIYPIFLFYFVISWLVISSH